MTVVPEIGTLDAILHAQRQRSEVQNYKVDGWLGLSGCRDEAACGQARAADGAGILAAQLFDVASQTDAESTLWDSSRIDESASQLAEALTTLVEVHTESQARVPETSLSKRLALPTTTTTLCMQCCEHCKMRCVDVCPAERRREP